MTNVSCFWNSWFIHERKHYWYLHFHVPSPTTSDSISREKLYVSDLTTDKGYKPA